MSASLAKATTSKPAMVAAIHNVTLVRQRMEAKPRRNSIIGLINPELPFK
ncbi:MULTISPECIES: hypothetical protein [unclassified Pseudomonas]|nr:MULTISPECIES: hypothetical protein [unclassified Pseudomonas]